MRQVFFNSFVSRLDAICLDHSNPHQRRFYKNNFSFKATLLSHDLMYRYDGRDSGNAAPKEIIEKVEEQEAG